MHIVRTLHCVLSSSPICFLRRIDKDEPAFSSPIAMIPAIYQLHAGLRKWMNAISPSGVMVIAFVWRGICNVYGICNENMYEFPYLCIYIRTHIYIYIYVCMYALKCVIRWWCAVQYIKNIMWGKKIWKCIFCSWTLKCLESEWNFHQISRSNLPAKVFSVKVQSSNKGIICRFCVLVLGHLPSLLFLHTLVVPRSVGGQVDKLPLGHTNVKSNREDYMSVLWELSGLIWVPCDFFQHQSAAGWRTAALLKY